ncbi:MAG: hypothetical protein KJP10_00530 [Gammaproteobacteria bacterium]|nr:hypothetical protein [Gammaproteobacteria bacterium]
MNIYRKLCMLLLGSGLLLVPMFYAAATDIAVYKGQLRITPPDRQVDQPLRIQYRSKTREVVRIAVDDLSLIDMETKKVISLPDRTASLANHYDHEGYWTTDISYDNLDLAGDNYRVEGRLMLYLLDSQRSRKFSAYLKPAAGIKPHDSSIDWGLDN